MSVHRTRFGRFLAVLASVPALLLSCTTAPTEVSPSDAPLPVPDDLRVLAAPGDIGVTLESGQFTSEYGCTVAYEAYTPEVPVTEVTVIMAHGFMGTMDGTRGWAELWASHGVTTVVLDFCNSTWLDGRQDRNARDMVALAALVADPSEPVIYAGFSAGGLSALIASGEDPRSIGYLGLDPVDTGDLADPAAPGIGPAFYVFSAPTSCNAQNNMIPKLTHRDGEIAVSVPSATHCDFLNPYASDCERVCGRVEPESVAQANRETITILATSWVTHLASDPESAVVGLSDLVARMTSLRRGLPVAKVD